MSNRTAHQKTMRNYVLRKNKPLMPVHHWLNRHLT
jgi:hypothetical protein